jgi:uncharacterized protein
MNYFSIQAQDSPDAPTKRVTHLDAHLAHVEAHLARYAVAGPLRDAQGKMTGSLLVVKAESVADAQRFLETDPYFIAGVWGAIEIRAFAAVAGDWVGGKAWGGQLLTR